MGKASSAKKVARAARAGGRSPREAPKVGFPLAIFAIVLLGSLLVFYARSSREPASAAAPSYLAKDHWHAAYGMYVCDHFLPPVTDAKEDVLGIHTHGEGVIHIHPFSAAASGDKARMGLFADMVGVDFTDDGWKMPDGTEYKTGYDCGGKPGKFAVYRYAVDDPNGAGDVFESNIDNIVFRQDRDAYVIAILPEGAEPPPLPPSISELDNLTDLADGGAAGQGGATTGGATTGGAVPGGATDSSLPTELTLVPTTVAGDPTGAGTPTGTTP